MWLHHVCTCGWRATPQTEGVMSEDMYGPTTENDVANKAEKNIRRVGLHREENVVMTRESLARNRVYTFVAVFHRHIEISLTM